MFFLQKHLVFDNLEVAPVHKCHKFEKRAKDINNRCTKYHAKSAKAQSFFGGAKRLRVLNLTQRTQRRKVFLGDAKS